MLNFHRQLDAYVHHDYIAHLSYGCIEHRGWFRKLRLPHVTIYHLGIRHITPTRLPHNRQSTTSHIGLGVGIALAILALNAIIAAIILVRRRNVRKRDQQHLTGASAPGPCKSSYFRPGTDFKNGEAAVKNLQMTTTHVAGRCELYGDRPRDGQAHEHEALTGTMRGVSSQGPKSGSTARGTRSELE